MKIIIVYEVPGRGHYYLVVYQNLAQREYPINPEWLFIVKQNPQT